MSLRCRCQHCGGELEPSHAGACPHCGKTGKSYVATIIEAIGPKASVSAETTRIYFEIYNRKISAVLVAIAVDIVIAIVGSMIGWAVGGLLGALIGLAVSVALIVPLNLFCRRKVKNQIREIRKYQ
jgi:hypothetical protein